MRYRPAFLKMLPFFVCAFLCTCTTKSARRIELMSDSAEKQDFAKTIKKIRKNPDLYGNLNQFLYWYDLGILFHYLGEYDTSRVHFEKAEKILDDLYARSITNEIASIITNDNLRPYRAKRYEQILLHQMLAFNYLAKDQPDEALVETRKVQLVFDRYASKDKDRDKYNDDGMSHVFASLMYDIQHDDDDAAISLYKAVSAYQNGPISLPAQVSDLAYYRLLQQGRENDIRELHLAPKEKPEQLTGSQTTNQSEIVLVGYGGPGPLLGETMFWGTYVVDGLLVMYYRNPNGDTVLVTLPAPPIPDSEKEKQKEKTRSGTTYHIKFAIPTLKTRPSSTDYFLVSAQNSTNGTPAGPSVKSVSLTDTDLLLERDMEDNRVKTVARTALRVVLRTIAAQKTKSELNTGQPLLNLFVNVGTDILADQLEKADTRLCFFLPRTIQMARIPVTPGTYKLTASANNRQGNAVDQRSWPEITVREGEKKFVFYPSLK